jgi:sulfate transport system substrate-binding protein
MIIRSSFAILITANLIMGSFTGCSKPKQEVNLLNVSYDPTRELYAEYNKAFANHWKTLTREEITISTSNGGSGSQSRLIQDGSEADVATLGLGYDIDAIYEKGSIDNQKPLIPKDWQSRLPHNSSPYTSTIVFLVRKGNPKHIKDWDDLIREDVSVITPNPKSSGGARWNYLAAWSYAKKHLGEDEQKIRDFLGKIYKSAQKNGLPAGARAATINFTERKLGDIAISWENEALMIQKLHPDDYEIVVPTLSILAEPPVTVVDGNVERHNTRKEATAYLEYLYSPEGQDIIGKNYYRPIDPAAKAKYAQQFPTLEMTSIADFGGWKTAQKTHFSDGGIFDQIIKGLNR